MIAQQRGDYAFNTEQVCVLCRLHSNRKNKSWVAVEVACVTGNIASKFIIIEKMKPSREETQRPVVSAS